MKGKGGKGSKGKVKTRPVEDDLSDDEDCKLSLPDLEPMDHEKKCLQFAQVVQRDSDEVRPDEIEALQNDLECLLNDVGKRMAILDAEHECLTSMDDPKDKAKLGKLKASDKSMQPASPLSGAKRKLLAGDDDASSVKSSGSRQGKRGKEGPPAGGKQAKKKSAKDSLAAFDFTDSPTPPVEPLIKSQKHEVPNRFWQMVEPYCADITDEHVKALEDLIRSQEEEGEYYKVPALGKHYSVKWAEEDLQEEQEEDVKLAIGKRIIPGLDNGVTADTDECDEDEASPFGPLTQRLIQGLLEENVDVDNIGHWDQGGDDVPHQNGWTTMRTRGGKELSRTVNHQQAALLERRIKVELEEMGLLDGDTAVEDDPSDSVLSELRKKQAELRTVSQQNVAKCKRLHRLAKEQQQIQQVRRKLDDLDNEVIEAYRKYQVARLKKKGSTMPKKEKETCLRLLAEREEISSKLHNMEIALQRQRVQSS